jgi:hypothetical protein
MVALSMNVVASAASPLEDRRAARAKIELRFRSSIAVADFVLQCIRTGQRKKCNHAIPRSPRLQPVKLLTLALRSGRFGAEILVEDRVRGAYRLRALRTR